jgi:cob(I)alamin adenosyltransferase
LILHDLMLYTRKGDKGTSGLFETKKRFPKSNAIYEALGMVDELNSLLGVCRACFNIVPLEKFDVAHEMLKIQQHLFIVQAELAGAQKSISQAQVDELENVVGLLEDKIKKPQGFVIPGATESSARCDYARAVSRRVERAVVNMQSEKKVSSATAAYLNRLSSFLYALARYAAAEEKVKELSPSY